MSFFTGFAKELLKLADSEEFSEFGGVGERVVSDTEPDTDLSPILHENNIPEDVSFQSDRQAFFHELLGRENLEGSGKITPGLLSNRHGTRR